MHILGGEGNDENPLSQKSKIFASSPRGRAKKDKEDLPNTVSFDDVIHILIAAAGEVDQHAALAHLLG